MVTGLFLWILMIAIRSLVLQIRRKKPFFHSITDSNAGATVNPFLSSGGPEFYEKALIEL